MEDITNLKENSRMNYIANLNNLVNYIQNDLAKDNNNPFNGCELIYLDKNNDLDSDWAIYVSNNGSITSENRIYWYNTLMKFIADYCKCNNSVNVLKRLYIHLN